MAIFDNLSRNVLISTLYMIFYMTFYISNCKCPLVAKIINTSSFLDEMVNIVDEMFKSEIDMSGNI